MEHAFISSVFVIDRKDFEQAYYAGHKKWVLYLSNITLTDENPVAGSSVWKYSDF